MGWCEQKNNQKIETFSPGNRRVQPGFDTSLTRIERSVKRNRWLGPRLPEVETLGIAWAAEIGLKGCFASPALSFTTSYDFWHGVADVFDDFLRSKVTGYWHETVNFRVQYANLRMRIEVRQIS